MTNQTIPADKLREAREWAQANIDGGYFHGGDRALAAAEVVLALTEDPTPLAEIKLGGWAMHHKFGEVLISCDRADKEGAVRVAYADAENNFGVRHTVLHTSDLFQHPDDADIVDTVTTTEHTDTPEPGEAWRAIWDHYGRTVTAIKRTDGHWWAIDGDEEPHVVARTGITTVTRLVPETPRKTLVTVEDYRNAPVGTVISYPAFFDDGVEDDWIDTAVKYGDGHWRSTGSVGYDDNHGLAGAAREVLWEPEA